MTTDGMWAAFLYGSVNMGLEPHTMFSALRFWNTYYAGVEMYYSNNVTFNGLTILGSLAAQDRNDVNSVGMYLSTYNNLNLVVQNSHIEGERIGIKAPTSDASQAGDLRPTVVRNTTLANYVNVLVAPVPDNRPYNGNALELRNDLFKVVPTIPSGPAPASLVPPPANIQMQLAQTTAANPYPQLNLTQPSTVKVYSYNRVAGDDFQVFYPEQAASFVMPQTPSAALSTVTAYTIGSPVAGRTNAQNWALYGIAVAGSVAPASASRSRSEINGLVATMQDVPLATGVTLVTPWQGAQVAGNTPLRVRYNVNGLLPDGSQLWFAVDGGKPFHQRDNTRIYHLAAGLHRLSVFIGDAQGNLWPGTHVVTHAFTITTTTAPAAVPALVLGGASSTAFAAAGSQTTIPPIAAADAPSPAAVARPPAPLLESPSPGRAARSSAAATPSEED